MFFFFNDTATTEIYTLSLHDALPIFGNDRSRIRYRQRFPEQDAAVLALQVETVLQVESNDDRHDEILRYGLQPDHEREDALTVITIGKLFQVSANRYASKVDGNSGR